MTLELTSSAFPHHGAIDPVYTCDGDGRSPPLGWRGAPDGTRSLALILDDPDAPDPAAPKTTFVHWVLYNLPADSTGLPEGLGPGDLPPGASQGLNGWDRPGYGGPCPPVGRHRYVHKLYALDRLLPDLGAVSKADLEAHMDGHVLERAELIGTYERP